MLMPDYFYGKTDRLNEIYVQWEDFVMQDIAQRILKAGEITATADRLIWKLKQAGLHQEAILKKLSQLTGLSTKELKDILQDAALTSWKNDADTWSKMGITLSDPLTNPAVVAVMNAEYKKSLGELRNLTRTTMKQSQQDLINMLDEAEIRVASGVQSYSSAVCQILDEYAGRGVMIEYPTGARRTLESAVRMCVVTSMNQTAAQVTNQYITEAETNYVLVSAHLGARVKRDGQPDLAGHDLWQGRVYSIRGSETGCPNLLLSTGYDIDPKSGKGKVVNPLGLHGYNCRHSHTPWDKRLRNPYLDKDGNLNIDSDENQKRYKLEQKQRYYERNIRKIKRQLLIKRQEIDGVAETDVKDILQRDYDKIEQKLHNQNKLYNEFCEKSGLQKQYDRVRIARNVFEKPSEKESSPRKATKGEFGVDWNKVQSQEYRKSLEKISNNTKVVDAVETRAKWALNNHNGKKTEELYAVSLDTGQEVANILNQNIEFAVKRTDAFIKKLDVADKGKENILLIHNHPRGLPPSLGDINALVRNMNVSGITVGHDGSIYYYSRPRKMISEDDFKVALMRYSRYTEITGFEKALEDLSKEYGFEFKKL